MTLARLVRTAFAIAIAATVLSACDRTETTSVARTRNAVPAAGAMPATPDTIATVSTSPHGWIVSDAETARKILQPCSRQSPDPDGKLPLWTPTPAQIASLERALPSLRDHVATPERTERQYVGIVKDDVRLVYVNASSNMDDSPARADRHVLDLSHVAMGVCDGGDLFWGVLWNPGTGEFSDFRANGPI